MDDDPRRELSPTERRQLQRSLTFLPRVMAAVFASGGLALGALVAIAGGFRPAALRSAATLTGAVLSVTAGVVGLMWLSARSRRRALLHHPLRAGSGRVVRVDRPDDGGGGSVRVQLALTLPDGTAGNGRLRVHDLSARDLQVGQVLPLWFSEAQDVFVLEAVVGADVGVVVPR